MIPTYAQNKRILVGKKTSLGATSNKGTYFGSGSQMQRNTYQYVAFYSYITNPLSGICKMTCE